MFNALLNSTHDSATENKLQTRTLAYDFLGKNHDIIHLVKQSDSLKQCTQSSKKK